MEDSPKSERGFVIRVTTQDCYLLDFIHLFCRFSYLHLPARGVCMRINQLGTKEGWWDHSADKGAAGHQAWEPEFSLVRLTWQKGRLDPWRMSSSLYMCSVICPHIINQTIKCDWRANSVIKSLCYSCKGPEFGSQHPGKMAQNCSRTSQTWYLWLPLAPARLNN